MVRDSIIKRGDQGKWMASCLTKLSGFPTKQREELVLTIGRYSSVIEGDMLKQILADIKSKGFTVDQIVIDHDTSANAIVV